QFVGKSGEIAESGIDTVSGATISSKAVLGAVNTVLASAAPAAPEAPAASGEGATVTANGLTGTFDVTVALDGSGAVSGVTLGEASSEMDAEYLAKVKGSDTFLAQFVGKSGEIAESGIDTVSGATISSKAVLGVVNTVLASAAPAASLETVPTESFPEDSGETVSDTSSDLTAIATTTARAKGVTGAFDVIIGLNSEGAVCSVELGDSDSEADYLYLKAVKEDKAFLNQFIGKTEVLSESDIDSVSGATVTSRAVLDAVNAAIASADDVLQAAKVPMFERTIKAKGMTGTFDVTVGINESGAVCGVAVGESNSEADYLYLKAVRESEKFLSQFTGKKNTVSANEIDTISGATLSSKAVLEAVNTVLALGDESAAAQTAEDEKTEPTAEPEPQATPTAVPAAATTAEPTPKPAEEYDGTRVKAKGETGTFDVSISLDENGAVSGVEIGRSTSEADELYLFAVKESEPFLAQLIGRTDYISPEEIDTVSGATVSSLAVVNAVNTLAGFPEPESPPHSADEKTTGASAETETEPAVDSPVPAVPAAPEAPAASDEGTTVTANGLTGTFDVTVALDGSGAVSGVTLGEASSEMDAEYLAKVKGSETFLAQFVGKSGEIAESGIDTVSGATISSKAVLGAVNTVLASAAPTAPEAITETEIRPETVPAVGDTANTSYVTASGLTGNFGVAVSLDENNTVCGIEIGPSDSEADTDYLDAVKSDRSFLDQFVGKKDLISEDEIDAVSGATVSSKAVLNAVNLAVTMANGGIFIEPTLAPTARPTAAPTAIPTARPTKDPVPEAADDGDTWITVKGLTGTFKVAVSLDETGAVTGIVIGETTSEADEAYLSAVKDSETFLSQFIGRTGTISVNDIDTVSGATVSSKAVLDAVNTVLNSAYETER
ncbi:MAG: FMN-binding protein, partial [Clostridia bacterium]|nr:FMN-binding protein [Clostridia bacterium]